MKLRICGIGALIALVLVLVLRPVASQEEQRSALEDRVDHTVREYGRIESSQTVRLVNEVPEEMLVLSVVPEGTTVKKGDLVVALDDSRLQDRQTQDQLEVAVAQAAFQQAAKEVESARKLAQHLAVLNASKVKVAELNQARYLSNNGQYDVSLRNAQREATLANARLTVLTNRIGRRKQAPAAADDVELLEFEAKQAREEAGKAQDQIQLLTNFERPYQLAVLELAVSQAKADLALQETQTQASILLAGSQLEASRLELAKAEADLQRINNHLAKCRVTAPVGGVVIYNTLNRRSASSPALEAGAKVLEGQPLVLISDVSQLQVRAIIHETRIDRVEAGQSARITTDALPNQSFQGKVLSVNQTPELTGWFDGGEGKSYAVLVSLDGPAEKLKLGLSALVEIDTKSK